MSFSSDLAGWVAKTKRRQEVVFVKSLQNLEEEILRRTPVDTGFLRSSFTVSIGEPVEVDGSGVGGPNIADLGKLDPNVPVYFGFNAAYAMRIEYGFDGEDSLGRYYYQSGVGMVRLSVQNWSTHVSQAVQEAKSKWRGRTKDERQ